MLFHEVVALSRALENTASRRAKIDLIGGLLRRAGPGGARLAASYLAGVLPQGRVGVGYATVGATDAAPVAAPTLTLEDVDAAFEEAAGVSGPGSDAARRSAVESLLGRATAEEQGFLVRLLLGEVRHGALEGVVADAVAHASGALAGEVRRALMVGGHLGEVAAAALEGGRAGLAAFRLTRFRPVRPMLAQSAASVADALERTGPAAVEVKYDGARIQVHAAGRRVRVFTRNLREATDRVPEVVEAVAGCGVAGCVLDGEAVLLGTDGRPRPFQETAGRFGSGPGDGGPPLTPVFFDLLEVGGEDLTPAPLEERRRILASLLPAALVVPGITTSDPAEAEGFMGSALDGGHEGVVVKALESPYEAGRRGSAWVKVKPVHTLDLVVLAAEWGYGRRTGLLSNLHLGARDPASGGFVMLGKTFKGLTDEMLRWQTGRFLELEERRTRSTVFVRPEQVVEVAFDGVQASPRYPGGVALRFARVRGYRHDKAAAEADTIDTVLAIHRGGVRPPGG